jgi:hypothetical protein
MFSSEKDDLNTSNQGGKPNPYNMMSPFEKRLQNYQKSAEMRKERSGSRGKYGPYGALKGQMNYSGSEGDFKNNLRTIQFALEDVLGKVTMQSQE